MNGEVNISNTQYLETLTKVNCEHLGYLFILLNKYNYC